MNEHGPVATGRDRSNPGSDLDLSSVVLGLRITVAAILVGWALHATASVSTLIVGALFLAIAIGPFHRAVIRRTGQSWLGHLSAFLVMLVAIALFAGGLFFAVQRIGSAFPALSEIEVSSMGQMFPGMAGPGADAATDPPVAPTDGADGEDARAETDGGQTDDLLADNIGGEVASRLAGFASSAAVTVMQFATAVVTGLTLVIFLALIMLVDAPNWHKRLTDVFGSDRADAILGAVTVTSHQLSRFVLVRAGIGVLTALLYMLWLWPFGIDLLIVWGVFALLLSFVPNLGSIASGLLPTVYVFLTKDFGTAMVVGTGLFVIEQVIGNYLDPRVQGKQVSVSPVVILTAMLLFIWIWGLPGALLSTPILIAMVVGFSRIDRLRAVAVLLSDTGSFEDLDQAKRR